MKGSLSRRLRLQRVCWLLTAGKVHVAADLGQSPSEWPAKLFCTLAELHSSGLRSVVIDYWHGRNGVSTDRRWKQRKLAR